MFAVEGLSGGAERGGAWGSFESPTLFRRGTGGGNKDGEGESTALIFFRIFCFGGGTLGDTSDELLELTENTEEASVSLSPSQIRGKDGLAFLVLSLALLISLTLGRAGRLGPVEDDVSLNRSSVILGIAGCGRVESGLYGRGGGTGPSPLLRSSRASSTEIDLSWSLMRVAGLRSGEELFFVSGSNFFLLVGLVLSSLMEEDSESRRLSNFLILLSSPRLIILGDFKGFALAFSCVSDSESDEMGVVIRCLVGGLGRSLPGSLGEFPLAGSE